MSGRWASGRPRSPVTMPLAEPEPPIPPIRPTPQTRRWPRRPGRGPRSLRRAPEAPDSDRAVSPPWPNAVR